MEHYYLSKEATQNGHEIHKSGCNNLPDVENRIYFGYLTNDADAFEEAKEYCQSVSICSKCMNISYVDTNRIMVNAGIKDTL